MIILLLFFVIIYPTDPGRVMDKMNSDNKIKRLIT